ncbi:MAG: radical SAM protein [Candidatus Omnitrophica bacterium]|nr:radical SAM protein [Candidatus Omnitrophota bacterium]
MQNKFKYIYGPVESWRMGTSLGIDPLSAADKICNLNCCYCQLGETHTLTNERKEYIPTREIVNELIDFMKHLESVAPMIMQSLDYLTFSGRGEPTLARNLGEMIRAVRQIRAEEIAVITNSTLLHLSEVQKELAMCDLVIAKLDACDEQSFFQIDKAISSISFEKTLKGIKEFKRFYSGKLAIQIMFVEENRMHASSIADIVRDINPDEIQINTPLRPSPARPLDKEGIEEMKSYFSGIPAVSAFERDRKETIPVNQIDTVKRHGNYKKNYLINNRGRKQYEFNHNIDPDHQTKRQ